MDHTARAAEVRPAETAKQLFAVANKAYRQGADSLRVAGEALLKAKAQVGHGEWSAELAKHWEFSPRHAQRAMKAARKGTPEQVIDAISGPDDGEDDTPKTTSRSLLVTDESPPTVRPAQTSDDPIPPPPPFREPSPPVKPRSNWAQPASSPSPSKLTDQKRVDLIAQHVPQPEKVVAGPDVVAFAGEVVGLGERFRDGLIALRQRAGGGTPDWLEVCVVVEQVMRFQSERLRKEVARG